MSLVFERFPYGGNERLLALALADHAHDDGTHIYPGNEVLAQKAMLSERTVVRMLQKFVQMGWLIKMKHGNGGRGLATVYRINPDWLKGDNLSPFMDDEQGGNVAVLSVDNSEKSLNLIKNETVTPVAASNTNRYAALQDTGYAKMTIKGDIMVSPFLNLQKGDIAVSEKGDIAVSKKGDIAMSPQPSLTIINHQTTPCAQAPAVDNFERVASDFASRLIKLNVKVTGRNKLLMGWVSRQLSFEFIEQCVAVARQQKPFPQVIPALYLDTIIKAELLPKAGGKKPSITKPWFLSANGIRDRGHELGIVAGKGEAFPAFKQRVYERAGMTVAEADRVARDFAGRA